MSAHITWENYYVQTDEPMLNYIIINKQAIKIKLFKQHSRQWAELYPMYTSCSVHIISKENIFDYHFTNLAADSNFFFCD